MDRMIYTAMSGAKATLSQQATVAHNLAHATTPGFRAQVQNLRAVAVQAPGLPTRAFAVDATVGSDFTPGAVQRTERPLDVAVLGAGWLVVQAPDGSEALTRHGRLEVSANGVLQTSQGYPVLGQGGTLTIPPETALTIGRDGSVSATRPGEPKQLVNLGGLRLVAPPPAQLTRGDDGLFRLRDGGAPAADPTVQVAAGYLEDSNVNPADTLVQMIALGRQFELQMRLLTTAEQNARAAGDLLTVS